MSGNGAKRRLQRGTVKGKGLPDMTTVKALFARSGNKCAFPACPIPLVDDSTGAILGEICHINATSPGGPRYDSTQSEISRQSPENLIILCPTHHSLIDKAPVAYPADKIRAFKRSHEAAVSTTLKGPPVGALTDSAAANFARQLQAQSVDFAIVVALPKELIAIRRHFPELCPVPVTAARTRQYWSATLSVDEETHYRVVVTLLRSFGNLEAAQATGELIHDWSPRFILVVGIAGGLNRAQQSFGDILVSRSIVHYEAGKQRDSEWEQRAKHFEADPTLLGAAMAITDLSWRTRLVAPPYARSNERELPRVHLGALASGEKVIASAAAGAHLKSLHSGLIGVEMETAGVASAAFSAVSKVGFLGIRSICDFADAKKDDNWQLFAADAAASYARALIDSRPVAPSTGSWPQNTVAPLIASRKSLFDEICQAVDLEEFKNLCFVLGVDYDELPGDRKSAKVRELILFFERRKQMPILLSALEERRRAPE